MYAGVRKCPGGVPMRTRTLSPGLNLAAIVIPSTAPCADCHTSERASASTCHPFFHLPVDLLPCQEPFLDEERLDGGDPALIVTEPFVLAWLDALDGAPELVRPDDLFGSKHPSDRIDTLFP